MFRAGFATAAILAASFSAHAADLSRPNYKAPNYSAPSSSWNGFYAGFNAGYGFGSSTNVALASTSAAFDPAFAAGAVPSTVALKPTG
jgi:outer membrane immunogenic protein